MEDQCFFADTQFTAHLGPRSTWRPWREEIVDDIDRAFDRQQANCLLTQKLRNGGDGVDTRQRVANRRTVARVVGEERRVGAVQRGDQARLLLGSEH